MRHTAAVEQILVACTEHRPQPVSAQCTMPSQWLSAEPSSLGLGTSQGSDVTTALHSAEVSASEAAVERTQGSAGRRTEDAAALVALAAAPACQQTWLASIVVCYVSLRHPEVPRIPASQ